MIRFFTFLLLTISTNYCLSQNLNGQWKGSFIDKSTGVGKYAGDKCDYVIELDVNGSMISGSSYTYFTENGKRFFTICKLEGSFDAKKKYLEIKETERSKTNIPINIRNCFQVHKLTYFKQSDIETLEGNWIPAPHQTGNCGNGSTLLTRRSLINSYPNAFSKANKKVDLVKSNPTINNNKSEELVKPESKNKIAEQKNEPVHQGQKIDEVSPLLVEHTLVPEIKNDNLSTQKIEARRNTLLKTIEIENHTIKVDLYDNGDIDGDSVSLFYNGKLLLSNKRLTEKSISLYLNLENNDSYNELIMYAENLGTIPPNTALIIITDGPHRFEVRISSDLEKSGVIRFVQKAKK